MLNPRVLRLLLSPAALALAALAFSGPAGAQRRDLPFQEPQPAAAAPEKPKKTREELELEGLHLMAENGKVEAQLALGFRYREGLGNDMSYKIAVKWFRRAAEQGSPAAQYALGLMCRKGAGTDKSYDEAASWLKKASQQGAPLAMYTLAGMYERGESGHRSDKEAFSLYRQAAERGEPQSQHALGAMYRDGRGVAADDKAAKQWLDLAAQRGVTQSAADTLRGLEKQAEKGDPVAQHVTGAMYRDGEGTEPNLVAAQRWFMRAAKQGYYPSQAALGVLYWQGFGVPRDVQEGYYWLYLATQKYPKYEDLRDRIAQRLTKSKMNDAEERAGTFSPVPEMQFTEKPAQR